MKSFNLQGGPTQVTRTIPFEVVRAAEDAAVNQKTGYHPKQELPIPAEFLQLLIQYITQAVEEGTDRKVMVTPVRNSETGEVTTEDQTVIMRTPFAHAGLDILRQLSILGIGYHAEGFTRPIEELSEAMAAFREGEYRPLIPMPGAPKAYLEDYYQAEPETSPSEADACKAEDDGCICPTECECPSSCCDKEELPSE